MVKPAYYMKERILVEALKKVPIYVVKGDDEDMGIRGCIVIFFFL